MLDAIETIPPASSRDVAMTESRYASTSDHGKRPMNWRILSVVLAVALVVITAFMWATDFVTMQGEWTIYTADCVDGQWQGSACTGRLKAADRYRFRVLKAHREVLFWTIYGSGASGRFTDCDVQDGRTWTCPSTADASRTVTRRMNLGIPEDDEAPGVMQVHRIPKWKWEALKRGLPVGSTALN